MPKESAGPTPANESRRSFLAKLGLGAAALAAVSANHGINIAIEFCGPNLMADQPFPFITGVEGAMRIVDAVGALRSRTTEPLLTARQFPPGAIP